MRNADECLEKARELELQALESDGLHGEESFMEMAQTWRRMACLAQLQDLFDMEPVGRA